MNDFLYSLVFPIQFDLFFFLKVQLNIYQGQILFSLVHMDFIGGFGFLKNFRKAFELA